MVCAPRKPAAVDECEECFGIATFSVQTSRIAMIDAAWQVLRNKGVEEKAKVLD